MTCFCCSMLFARSRHEERDMIDTENRSCEIYVSSKRIGKEKRLQDNPSESPFDERKIKLNQHLNFNVLKYHLTKTMYISSFGWKRFLSIERFGSRRHVLSSLEDKKKSLSSHLLPKLLSDEAIQRTYLFRFFLNSWLCFCTRAWDLFPFRRNVKERVLQRSGIHVFYWIGSLEETSDFQRLCVAVSTILGKKFQIWEILTRSTIDDETYSYNSLW